MGRRGGTVVGPDGSLMVGHDLPGCLVCVGVLVGVADTGVNQPPFGQGHIGTRMSSYHDTMYVETMGLGQTIVSTAFDRIHGSSKEPGDHPEKAVEKDESEE